MKTCTWIVVSCCVLSGCVGMDSAVPPLGEGLAPSSGREGCAVNAAPPRITHTYNLSPLAGANVGAGSFPVIAGAVTGCWSPATAGDLLGMPLRLEVGERIESATASIYGNSGFTILMSLIEDDDAFHAASEVVHSASVASNTLQTVSFIWQEDVTSSLRNYALQFRANRTAASEGVPIVGPITLVTSSAAN